jgi:hypothetical protein
MEATTTAAGPTVDKRTGTEKTTHQGQRRDGAAVKSLSTIIT